MRRGLRVSALVVTAVVLAAAIPAGVGTHAGQTAKTIRVLYTNDTMGYADPCG
ncbi:MAG: hypothetical protein M1133_14365 [Armatimonadetes bacterium]|nr:hypothetical protein [Armatimonadota bacterium]